MVNQFILILVDTMEDPLTEFRRTVVGRHITKPWAIRFRELLRFLTLHPQYARDVGLIPAGTKGFFVNSQVCARFLGSKCRNSLNRNFQEHGFKIDQTANVADELKFCSPQLITSHRCWSKRVFDFGDFNGESSNQQTDLASNYARLVRIGAASTIQRAAAALVTGGPQTDTPPVAVAGSGIAAEQSGGNDPQPESDAHGDDQSGYSLESDQNEFKRWD
jgi:hypothetical protein